MYKANYSESQGKPTQVWSDKYTGECQTNNNAATEREDDGCNDDDDDLGDFPDGLGHERGGEEDDRRRAVRRVR